MPIGRRNRSRQAKPPGPADRWRQFRKRNGEAAWGDRLVVMAEGNDRAVALHRGEVRSPEMFTVKDVAEACGLPQPVVAQLVPRTWAAAEGGWMYTADQLRSAVEIAAELRRTRLKSVSY